MYEDSYSPGLAQAKPRRDRYLNSKILERPRVNKIEDYSPGCTNLNVLPSASVT